MEKRNSQCDQWQPSKETRSLFCICDSGVANEFDARSVLHGQVSLAAINQIFVIHEAMKALKI